MKRGWFGPRAFGFGVSPSSWQGWLATGLFVLAMIGVGALLPEGGVWRWTAHGGVILVFLTVVALTRRPGARDRS